jgi:hypothetical protein
MDLKDVVRRGYDKVSLAYRADDFALAGSGYETWLADMVPRLKPGSRILDLGCGCGVPVSRALAERAIESWAWISPPFRSSAPSASCRGATFECRDMTAVTFAPASFEAVVDLFAIIHVPLEEQPCPANPHLIVADAARSLSHDRGSRGVDRDRGRLAWCSRGDDVLESHGPSTYRGWLEMRGFRILAQSFSPRGAAATTSSWPSACDKPQPAGAAG